MLTQLPKDPLLLYGFINLKLRDYYPSLSALCDDLEADEKEIIKTLGDAGFTYNKEQNRFN